MELDQARVHRVTDETIGSRDNHAMAAIGLDSNAAFRVRISDQHPGNHDRGTNEGCDSRIYGPKRHGRPVPSEVQTSHQGLNDRKKQQEAQEDPVKWLRILAYRLLALFE